MGHFAGSWLPGWVSCGVPSKFVFPLFRPPVTWIRGPCSGFVAGRLLRLPSAGGSLATGANPVSFLDRSGVCTCELGKSSATAGAPVSFGRWALTNQPPADELGSRASAKWTPKNYFMYRSRPAPPAPPDDTHRAQGKRPAQTAQLGSTWSRQGAGCGSDQLASAATSA